MPCQRISRPSCEFSHSIYEFWWNYPGSYFFKLHLWEADLSEHRKFFCQSFLGRPRWELNKPPIILENRLCDGLYIIYLITIYNIQYILKVKLVKAHRCPASRHQHHKRWSQLLLAFSGNWYWKWYGSTNHPNIYQYQLLCSQMPIFARVPWANFL